MEQRRYHGSLMTTDVKITKILAKWIRYHSTEGLYTMIKWDLFPECKDDSLYENWSM